MDRRRMLLIGLAVLVVISVVDVYVNGIGVFEQFGRGFTLQAESQEPKVTMAFEASQEAVDIKRLYFSGQSRAVKIRGEATDRITYAVNVRVFAKDTESATAYVEGFQLDPAFDGTTAVPRIVEGPRKGVERVAVTWEVTVPKHLIVEVTNGLGTVTVSDVDAPITITASGSVDVVDVGGPIRISSQGGFLKVRQVEGDASLETSFGSIEVTGVSGNVDLKTSTADAKVNDVGGRVTVDGNMAAIELDRIAGGVKASHSLGFIGIRNVSGTVDLSVTNGAAIIRPRHAAPIDAKVSGGDITLEIPPELVMAYDFALETKQGEILQNPEFTRLLAEQTDREGLHPAKVEVDTGTLNVRLAQ